MGSVRRLSMVWVWLFAVLTTTVNSQGLRGDLAGSVTDEQGRSLDKAVVRLTSPAIMGDSAQRTTNERGRWRFTNLNPGSYVLTIEAPGFKPYIVENISVGAGDDLELPVVVGLANVTVSTTVTAGRRLDSWESGLEARFTFNDLATIPARRNNMFSAVKSAPGVSPSSPTSPTVNTVSIFGSGVNENGYLIDGNNSTCSCQGGSRAEPGEGFTQEIVVKSSGASVEFGNIQGGVVNVVTRQGGARFQYDASYYGQFATLTSQPVTRSVPGTEFESQYERDSYRDGTTTLGGPIARDFLWFFGGYQYLRDYDSQPGTNPAFPRTYEQDKLFGKLTWKLTPSMHLMQSYHQEFWVNPTLPTLSAPFETTQRVHASVPAITFGDFTHSLSNNTMWEARAGRFVLHQKNDPSSGDRTTPSRSDTFAGTVSDNAPQIGSLTIDRFAVKAVLHRYESGWLGADHHFKAGTQLERGSHRSPQSFPGGVQYVDRNGARYQAVYRAPWTAGGELNAVAAFFSDSFTVKDRVTIDAGLRYDYNRGASQELPAVDAAGNETEDTISGLGTLFDWNVFSPRMGASMRLTEDGRTMLRASYGLFVQGVLTGEADPFHPGTTPTTTMEYEAATGGYTKLVSVIDPRINLSLDPQIGPPRTHEYSVSFERVIVPELMVSAAYVGKRGTNFIAWEVMGGEYADDTTSIVWQETITDNGETTTVTHAVELPLKVLTSPPADRRFVLTNPPEHFLRYDGLLVALEKRLSQGWQASASYTFSRAYGRQVTSNSSAAEAQFSTIARANYLTFGQDPNDLTNTEGRLANDRPHMFRTTGSAHLPWGVLIAGSLQAFSGRPWAAAVNVNEPLPTGQRPRRILTEPRGSRRMSSQTLFDLRVGKRLALGPRATLDLRIDVLNLLNDSAEEGLASDLVTATNFGHGSVFMDPRRLMLSVQLNFGQ